MNKDIVNEEIQPEALSEAEKSEEICEEAENAPEKDEREALLVKINELQEKVETLEKERSMQERTMRELGEFTSLFPDSEIESIPDEVWAGVRNGTSLAASYALYKAKCKREAERIEKINSNNAIRSAGRAGIGTAGEYFSPDEVRRMSPAEVHANYAKIKDSMKKWL